MYEANISQAYVHENGITMMTELPEAIRESEHEYFYLHEKGISVIECSRESRMPCIERLVASP
jgi:hypothetical protein